MCEPVRVGASQSVFVCVCMCVCASGDVGCVLVCRSKCLTETSKHLFSCTGSVQIGKEHRWLDWSTDGSPHGVFTLDRDH